MCKRTYCIRLTDYSVQWLLVMHNDSLLSLKCVIFSPDKWPRIFWKLQLLWGQFISITLTVTCLAVKLLSHILCTSGLLYETFHKLWITRYNHMYLINFLGRYENERWRGSCPVVGFVISSVLLLEFCYHRVSFSINIRCSVQ